MRGPELVFAVAASFLAHIVVVGALAATLGFAVLRGDVAPSTREDVVVVARPIGIQRRASRPFETALSRFESRMRGRRERLPRGQGYYEPLSSWNADGVRYYRVAYEFAYRDGTFETGLVPWAVHFAPGADPFALSGTSTPLPAPPPDYLPPGTLGKALRAYFPRLLFED